VSTSLNRSDFLEEYSVLRQVVPSSLCLTCEVCCRFPEETSFLAPYFTGEEIEALSSSEKNFFAPGSTGGKVKLIPHGEGYICPFFDPKSHECRVYHLRPLDCRIYPYALMRDRAGAVVLGIDTKCPYMQEEEAPLRSAASETARFLESDAIIGILLSHPELIGPYQDDVFIVRSLEKLTALMGREISPDDQA
jgi:hypothetical protein